MSNEGWTPPRTDADIWEWFSAKHGDDAYTREIHRRWSRLGKQIEKGTKIRDGRLG